MRLIVIDGGFATDHGHHYAMNEFICKEGKQVKAFEDWFFGPKLFAQGTQRHV